MDNLANIEQTELDLERGLSDSKAYQWLRESYEYCLICGSPKLLEAHHLTLRSQGGLTVPTNLVLLCRTCHNAAHGIPSSSGKTLWLKRGDEGVLQSIDRATGEAQILDTKVHVPTEAEGVEAYQLHSNILECKERIEGNFFMMGDELRKMRDNSRYLALGYESFNAYLASPELSINRAQAYKLMNIAGQCKRLNLEPSSLLDIDKDKLALVLPSISSEEDPQIKIAAARSLSRSDLKALYSGEEPHEQDDTEHSHTCRSCGVLGWYPGS